MTEIKLMTEKKIGKMICFAYWEDGEGADLFDQFIDEYRSFKALIESQKEEIENLREMKIRRIEVENGAINFSIQGEAGMSFAAILLRFYEDNGGKNFFTFDVEKDGMRLSTTIENKHGELTVSEKLNQQSREIKYLKAITELAVKCFEVIANGNLHFPTWADTVDILRDVRLVAKETLADIERLTNELHP